MSPRFFSFSFVCGVDFLRTSSRQSWRPLISAEELAVYRRYPFSYPSSFFVSFSVYFVGDVLPRRVFRTVGGVSRVSPVAPPAMLRAQQQSCVVVVHSIEPRRLDSGRVGSDPLVIDRRDLCFRGDE